MSIEKKHGTIIIHKGASLTSSDALPDNFIQFDLEETGLYNPLEDVDSVIEVVQQMNKRPPGYKPHVVSQSLRDFQKD